MPGGGVITPGAENSSATSFLPSTATSVDESAGTVTLTVERSGDTSQAITVNYNTIDGTANAGADLHDHQRSAQLRRSATASQDIVIPILTDSIAEGFESFNVAISNPTSPFLVTVGTATRDHQRRRRAG